MIDKTLINIYDDIRNRKIIPLLFFQSFLNTKKDNNSRSISISNSIFEIIYTNILSNFLFFPRKKNLYHGRILCVILKFQNKLFMEERSLEEYISFIKS